jgi:hypothetical protein
LGACQKGEKTLAQRLQGKRLLDVGTGQGPYGAAMMASPVANLQYYVGLDPDVCPPVHARTRIRDITFPHRGSDLQCLKAYNLTIDDDLYLHDPRYIECNGGEKKYIVPTRSQGWK